MRATLLKHDAWVAALLACAFDYAGIPLATVGSLPALNVAIAQARPDDFVILDLVPAGPADLARYAGVLGQTAVPVHVVYRDEALLAPLLASAAAAPILLSVETGWLGLPDRLQELQRRVYGARLARLRWPLTAKQRRVLLLLGEGYSRAEIAARLRVGPGTVKTHIKRLREKLGVRRMAELRAIARLGIL